MFEAELAARERIATLYDSRLGNCLATPARVPDAASAWAVYAVLLPDAASRDRLQAACARPACRPPSTTRAAAPPAGLRARHDGTALPVSEDLATRIMALPIHPDLTDADGSGCATRCSRIAKPSLVNGA